MFIRNMSIIAGVLLLNACSQNTDLQATPPQVVDNSGNIVSTATTSFTDASMGITALSVNGLQRRFIQDQVIAKEDGNGNLEKWLKDNGGRIIDNGDIPKAPSSIPRSIIREVKNDYRLVEVKNFQPPSSLGTQALKGMSFASESGKKTFLASQALATLGLNASLNEVMSPAGAAASLEGADNYTRFTDNNLWNMGAYPGTNVLNAFDKGYVGKGAWIAVIDSGFYTPDAELFNTDLVVGGTRDFRLYQSSFWTYDFANNNYTLPNTADPASDGSASWHGMHTAQMAFGALGNHVAGAGTAPSAKAYLFRTYPISYWQTARAVNTATAWGAQVISMSFGGFAPSGNDGGSGFGSALQNAANNLVVNVAAAGNNGAYSSKETFFGNVFIPAAWNTVIGVGAIDSSGNRSIYGGGQSSNYGPVAEIWAPGSNVGHSPDPSSACWSNAQCSNTGNGLSGFSGFYGTSAAAPVVAGIAGLLKTADSNLSVYTVRTVLQNTAATNPTTGAKIVDAAAALRSVVIAKGGTW